MNYRVVYPRRLADAVHSYTFLALQTGRDWMAVSRATDAIDLTLSDDPATAGESREGAERVLIVHPVTVFYEVFEAAKVVVVFGAVFYPRFRA